MALTLRSKLCTHIEKEVEHSSILILFICTRPYSLSEPNQNKPELSLYLTDENPSTRLLVKL